MQKKKQLEGLSPASLEITPITADEVDVANLLARYEVLGRRRRLARGLCTRKPQARDFHSQNTSSPSHDPSPPLSASDFPQCGENQTELCTHNQYVNRCVLQYEWRRVRKGIIRCSVKARFVWALRPATIRRRLFAPDFKLRCWRWPCVGYKRMDLKLAITTWLEQSINHSPGQVIAYFDTPNQSSLNSMYRQRQTERHTNRRTRTHTHTRRRERKYSHQ